MLAQYRQLGYQYSNRNIDIKEEELIYIAESRTLSREFIAGLYYNLNIPFSKNFELTKPIQEMLYHHCDISSKMKFEEEHRGYFKVLLIEVNLKVLVKFLSVMRPGDYQI